MLVYAFRERRAQRALVRVNSLCIILSSEKEVEQVSATCLASRMNYSAVRKPKAIA